MIDKDIELLQEQYIKMLSEGLKTYLTTGIDSNKDIDLALKNYDPQLSFNFMAVAEEKRYGATCQSCKENYPYAEAVNSFTCWSCKNF